MNSEWKILLVYCSWSLNIPNENTLKTYSTVNENSGIIAWRIHFGGLTFFYF